MSSHHKPRHLAQHFYWRSSDNTLWIHFTTGEIYQYSLTADVIWVDLKSWIDVGLNFGDSMAAFIAPSNGLTYTRVYALPTDFDDERPGFVRDTIP